MVVGAGLSGLTAGWTLQKAGWQVTVLEASDVCGGRTATVYKDGYIIDTGASALATSYHAYLELVEELGMTDQIVATSSVIEIMRSRRRYSLDAKKLLLSGLTTKLLSPLSKFTMSLLVIDVLLAKLWGHLKFSDMSSAAGLDTESAREYASRRLGKELTEYLCDPLCRMMLIANSDNVSRVELFSALVNIIGSRLLALRGGVNALPQALAKQLDVRLNSTVNSVRTRQSMIEVQLQGEDQENKTMSADACILTCPLPEASRLAHGHNYVMDRIAAELDYTSCITVSLGTTVRPETDALLLPMPACESPEVALVFMDHNKCNDRSPEGRYLINVHWVAEASSEYKDADDEIIVQKTLNQLLPMFPELEGAIEMKHVMRWSRALPWTRPGAYILISELNASMDTKSPLQYAGDYLSCAGQNTAIETGKRAAENIIEQFSDVSRSSA